MNSMNEGSGRQQHKWWMVWLALGLFIAYLLYRFIPDTPVSYEQDLDHFKYGSIGSEGNMGIPYWIFKAIPYLKEEGDPDKFLAKFGYIYEPGREFPIGFSQRTVQGVKRVWLNCAGCHTGSVIVEGKEQIIVGAPANQLKLYDFIQYMRGVALDNRFDAEKFMDVIEKTNPDMDFIDRLVYRYLGIGATRKALLDLNAQLDFLERQLNWGPGRVDTFNPYKAIQFNFPMNTLPDEEINAAADYPSIWMQKPREGMNLHWDGNNASLMERNLSASLGAGVSPVTVDYPAVKRVANWLMDFPAPKYPGSIDQALVKKGEGYYQQYCSSCHGHQNGDSYQYSGDGIRTGEIEKLAEIGTDRHRWLAYTPELAGNQNSLYSGYDYRFSQFKKTAGYANQPLDGIWARAPYLHNGSVPTIRDLLEPQSARPTTFYRGNTQYDSTKLGFVSTQQGDAFWLYDTRKMGNGNMGHEGPQYGTDLSSDAKDAIVEYMKTF